MKYQYHISVTDGFYYAALYCNERAMTGQSDVLEFEAKVANIFESDVEWTQGGQIYEQ